MIYMQHTYIFICNKNFQDNMYAISQMSLFIEMFLLVCHIKPLREKKNKNLEKGLCEARFLLNL